MKKVEVTELTVEDIEQAIREKYGNGSISFHLTTKQIFNDVRDPPSYKPILKGATIKRVDNDHSK